MLLFHPMPGHEERNEEFLLNSGCAMKTSEHTRMEDWLQWYLLHPQQKECMVANIRRVHKPHATADLCRLLENMTGGKKENI